MTYTIKRYEHAQPFISHSVKSERARASVLCAWVRLMAHLWRKMCNQLLEDNGVSRRVEDWMVFVAVSEHGCPPADKERRHRAREKCIFSIVSRVCVIINDL